MQPIACLRPRYSPIDSAFPFSEGRGRDPSDGTLRTGIYEAVRTRSWLVTAIDTTPTVRYKQRAPVYAVCISRAKVQSQRPQECNLNDYLYTDTDGGPHASSTLLGASGPHSVRVSDSLDHELIPAATEAWARVSCTLRVYPHQQQASVSLHPRACRALTASASTDWREANMLSRLVPTDDIATTSCLM